MFKISERKHTAKVSKKTKITLFLLCLVLSFNTTFLFGQNKQLTLNLKNVDLKELFENIEKQSGYTFSYRDVILRQDKDITLNIRNQSVKDVLNAVLPPRGLSYSIDDNYIQILKSTKTSDDKRFLVGTITDELGDPIIGASISLKGMNIGTVTDVDGNFKLDVIPNSVLVISYIGYQTIEINWDGQESLDLILKEDTRLLDEVVVVGFATQRKANLTGSVSQVKMEDVLGDRPVMSAAAALQGTIPGLTVSGGSSPGQAKNFNIRGIYSFKQDGSTVGAPLILIDNVEGDIDMLNPEDIESVTVLKDAASSAIYGARAAGGVILVTTKRPAKETKIQINYNFNIGFEESINKPEQTGLENYLQAYLDADYSPTYWARSQNVEKWLGYVKEYKENPSKFTTVGDGIYIDESGIPYYLNEKDLFANMLTTGVYSNHNLSVLGVVDKLKFRISAGYSAEDGPLVTSKDKYNRKNISAFLGGDLTKWFTQEANFSYTESIKTMPKNETSSFYGLRLVSYYPEGLAPMSLISGADRDLPFMTSQNMLNLSNKEKTATDLPRIFLKSIIKPVHMGGNPVRINFEYTYSKKNSQYDYYSGLFKFTDIQMAVNTSPSQQDMYQKHHYYTKHNAINLYTDYENTLGKHYFKVMGGFNQESSDYQSFQGIVYKQAAPEVPSFEGGTGEKVIKDLYSEYTVRGGFGRINYVFDEKYLFEANGRYDGSSKFPKANRYGFFPSVSLGWQLGKESFMAFTDNWLDELKLRASYGEIGNQNINPYEYNPSMSIGLGTAWIDNGDKVTIIGIPSLVRNNFTWENVKTLDVGLDYGMLKGRLQATFDWYQRDTDGILSTGMDLPAVVGTSAPLQNTAAMRTRGWELGVSWRDVIGDFGYSIGANVYDHTSKISKYNDNEAKLLSSFYEGQEFNEIWGYVSDGYYTIDDFDLEKAKNNEWVLKEGVTAIQGYIVKPGDEKFLDLDGDGSINSGANTLEKPGDRKKIGNSTPRFQFGANLGADYKGFALNIMLQGVGKRDFWLGGSALFPFAGSGATDAVFQPIYYNQTEYWTPVSRDPQDADYMVATNPNAKLFRIYDQGENVGSNTRVSDKYLQNSAYLRIKNITLSYSFKKKLLQNIGLSHLKLFTSIENLATFSSLPKGYDPESLSWSYPFYRTISMGASVTF